jgi:hypothetical protein
MIEFLWQFNGLRVQAQQDSLSDVMVSVKYRLCCTDHYRSVYRYGEVDFAPADPDAFTPFDAVTEEAMIGFVEQTMGESLDAIKAEMIAEHSMPPVEDRPLPWLKAVDTGGYADFEDSAFSGGGS